MSMSLLLSVKRKDLTKVKMAPKEKEKRGLEFGLCWVFVDSARGSIKSLLLNFF
jgi:hypothetical protein